MALPTHPSDLLPPAPLEGNNAFASMELATQGMDSSFQFADEPPVMPGIDEIGHASQEPSILSPRDMDVDLEATTQVLDTLDALDAQFALDQSIMSPRPEEEVAPTSESALPPPDAAPAPEKEVVRVLPEWMTATKAPVVTRRSLYLHTQTRHRKKQEQVDSDSVWDSSLPYVDIMRPSEMCLDRVICFDVESTGFGKTDGIIEIGAVEYILGQRTGAIFQSYIKPSVPINTHAVDVHGITNHMLAAAPLAKLIIPSFLSWVGSAPLVAHNARFDMRMLLQETSKLGLDHILAKKPVYCTMRSYRKVHPGKPYALIDLYTDLLGADRYASNSQICNPKLPNHSALVDAEILGEVFLKLAEGSLSTQLSS